MCPLNLSEYDPLFDDQSLLHVTVRISEGVYRKFAERVTKRFSEVEFRYDSETGILLLIVDKKYGANVVLPELAEIVHSFDDGEVEIVETRMAVSEEIVCRRIACFSRYISINHDGIGSDGKKFALRMAPSTVFGSGTHPSTKLAVMALEKLYTGGDFPSRALDVGCGSGILSFVSCLFGASDVVGIDVSPDAISAAEKNKKMNRLDCRVEFSLEDLSNIQGTFDLVIANVSVAVMSGMLDNFKSLVNPGGSLVLSGLQGRQQKEMIEMMKDRDFEVVAEYGQDQWRAILLAAGDARP